MSAAKIYSVLADGVVIFQLLLKIPLPDLQITTKLQVFKHFYQLCSLLGKAPSTDSIEAKSLPTLRRILYSHKNGYNCRQIFVIFGQKQFQTSVSKNFIGHSTNSFRQKTDFINYASTMGRSNKTKGGKLKESMVGSESYTCVASVKQ